MKQHVTNLKHTLAKLSIGLLLLGISPLAGIIFSVPAYAASHKPIIVSCPQVPEGVVSPRALSDQQLSSYGLPIRLFHKINQSMQHRLLQHMKHRSCQTSPTKAIADLPHPAGVDACSTAIAYAPCWSYNWAGMIDIQHNYNYVQGEWRVPCVWWPPANSNLAIWAGLGGQDSSSPLVQAGVLINSDGTVSPFIEVAPFNTAQIPTNFNVNCYDQMFVAVSSSPGVAGSDDFLLEDETTGNWYATQSGSPEQSWPVINPYSYADWIAELPSHGDPANPILDANLYPFGQLWFNNAFTLAPDIAPGTWTGAWGCPSPDQCEGGWGPGGTAGNLPYMAASMYSQSNTDSSMYDARALALSSSPLGATNLANAYGPYGYEDNSQFYVVWQNPN